MTLWQALAPALAPIRWPHCLSPLCPSSLLSASVRGKWGRSRQPCWSLRTWGEVPTFWVIDTIPTRYRFRALKVHYFSSSLALWNPRTVITRESPSPPPTHTHKSLPELPMLGFHTYVLIGNFGEIEAQWDTGTKCQGAHWKCM